MLEEQEARDRGKKHNRSEVHGVVERSPRSGLAEEASKGVGLARISGQLHVDNESAISLSHNPVFHSRTKHIEVHWHFIREAIKKGHVEVLSVKSKDQLADFLTKALNGKALWNNMERIGLKEGMEENDHGIEAKGGS